MVGPSPDPDWQVSEVNSAFYRADGTQASISWRVFLVPGTQLVRVTFRTPMMDLFAARYTKDKFKFCMFYKRNKDLFAVLFEKLGTDVASEVIPSRKAIQSNGGAVRAVSSTDDYLISVKDRFFYYIGIH